MDTHNRILSILYIISGTMQVIAMLFVSTVLQILLPFIMEEAGPEGEWIFVWIIPFIRVIGVVIVVLFALPSILGGIGLLNGKRWALTILLILGCFKLFAFPLGTLLGIYTIWVYSQNQKQPTT